MAASATEDHDLPARAGCDAERGDRSSRSLKLEASASCRLVGRNHGGCGGGYGRQSHYRRWSRRSSRSCRRLSTTLRTVLDCLYVASVDVSASLPPARAGVLNQVPVSLGAQNRELDARFNLGEWLEPNVRRHVHVRPPAHGHFWGQLRDCRNRRTGRDEPRDEYR